MWFSLTDSQEHVRQGKGYNAVNERTGTDTGVINSGRERLMTEAASQKFEGLLDAMEAGTNSQYEMYSLLPKYSRSGGSTMVVNNHASVQAKGLQWVPFVTKDGRQGAIVKKLDGVTAGDIIYFE